MVAVYVADGPMAGNVTEVHDRRSFTGLLVHPLEFGGRPRREPDRFKYHIHRYAESVIVATDLRWAFPQRKFITWELSDLHWAKSKCIQVECDVIEVREWHIAATGKPSNIDGRPARELVAPEVSYRIDGFRLPNGFAWPADYRW